MNDLLKPLAMAALIALASPLAAQETESGETGDQPVLDMGQDIADARQPGDTYVDEVFGDWERKCAFNPDGDDPCQIYQLLKDQNDNPVAEISVVRLPDGQEAAAGATVVVPLETLLTQQLTIGVDGGNARRYPFRFCAQLGCVSQIGFTEGEIAALKAGAVANVTIVPAVAPNQKVNLTISLTGFTAAYDSVHLPDAN